MNGNLVATEPVAFAGALVAVVNSGIAVIVLLVPDLRNDPALMAAILGFGNAFVALAVVVWTRGRVTPVASPTLPAGTTVTVETAPGQPNITTILPQG